MLKSELAKRINAINTLAVPVVTYIFNIINWKMEELMRLDRKTRKFLTTTKMHRPKADVDRLYIPRKAGGRGLVQLEITYKTTTIGLNTHLNNKDDYLLKIARDRERGKKTMSNTTKPKENYCCPRPMHQDQLLPKQDPERWH